LKALNIGATLRLLAKWKIRRIGKAKLAFAVPKSLCPLFDKDKTGGVIVSI
jgi:hypothetical protein